MSKIRIVGFLAGSCCILLAAGCGNGAAFPTAQVSGQVLCEGQPVSGAMVYFEPLRSGDQASAMVGKQGFAFTDSDGRYVISTYAPGEGDGAVVGKHRVRVGRGDAECDCSMNEEVDLMQVDVKADTDNTFELVLKKASSRERMMAERNRDLEDEE